MGNEKNLLGKENFMKYKAYTLILLSILLSFMEIRIGLQLNEAILMSGLFFVGLSFLRVKKTADLLWEKDLLFTIASSLLMISYILMLIGGIVQHRVTKFPLFYIHVFFDMLYFLTLVTKLKHQNTFLIVVTGLYILSQSVLMVNEVKLLLVFLQSDHSNLDTLLKTSYVLIWDIFRISLLVIAYYFIKNKPAGKSRDLGD